MKFAAPNVTVLGSAAPDLAMAAGATELERRQAGVDDDLFGLAVVADESVPDSDYRELAEIILTTIRLGSEVGDVVVAGPKGDRIYVATVDAVAVIDGAYELVRTVPVAGHPKCMMANADGTRVFVTSYDGSVVVINTVDNAVTTRRGARSTADAVSQDGTCIYTGHSMTVGGGWISVLNAEDTTTLALPVVEQIIGLVVSPDGRHLYAAASRRVSHRQYDTGSILVIDTGTFTVLDMIAVGVSPNTLTVTPDGSRIYVSHYDTDSISVVDLASRNVTPVALPDSPLDVTVTPDGNHLYATNRDSLAVIDAATNAVELVAVGTLPRRLQLSLDGNRVYVTNFGDHTVSVIDTLTNAVATTFTVGGHPEAMAISPNDQRLYVTDYWARRVTVISIPTVMTHHDINERQRTAA